MGILQILVQAITLGDQLLLPLPEPILLHLDLLCEPLPQALLLFFELWIVQLSWPRLTELSRLHLLRAVRFVVHLFSCVNQV